MKIVFLNMLSWILDFKPDIKFILTVFATQKGVPEKNYWIEAIFEKKSTIFFSKIASILRNFYLYAFCRRQNSEYKFYVGFQTFNTLLPIPFIIPLTDASKTTYNIPLGIDFKGFCFRFFNRFFPHFLFWDRNTHLNSAPL
jgi:hypothetical protein